MQRNCGIQAGNRVKILRKAKSFELGWNNSWSSDMDELIGKEFTVGMVNGYMGIQIRVSYRNMQMFKYVPFFILEKVSRPESFIRPRPTLSKKCRVSEILDKSNIGSSICNLIGEVVDVVLDTTEY